jgi:homoserine O-succinyltransferase
MALIRTSGLPAFETMATEGVEVEEGSTQQLRVGLLNLMPDAALRATDRQFMRLISAGARDRDIAVYPFTVAAEARGPEARAHIEQFYSSFESLQDEGLDALVITGANPAHHLLEDEAFWPGLGDVLDWGRKETGSILCSCLATHAVLQRHMGLVRTRLPQKQWGVYDHRRVGNDVLLDGLGDTVEAPHSHWYNVTRDEFESLGLRVLLESDQAGVHMVVDPDVFWVFFQGHPEYDLVSLLKEYRRELGRYWRGERDDYPPVPENYFDETTVAELVQYRPVLVKSRADDSEPPRLDETRLLPKEPHPWNTQGQVIFANWLDRVASR